MVLLSTLKGYSQSKGYGTEYSHYKAKGAYEGTWLICDTLNTTEFIVRLKALYRVSSTGDTLTEILGVCGWKNVQTSHDSLISAVSIFHDYRQLSDSLIYSFPLWGGVSETENYFMVHENINQKAISSLPFKLKIQKLNKSNRYIYWDLWDEGVGLEHHIITGKEPKPGEFNIPEKCTLTRVSHDPMYGL